MDEEVANEYNDRVAVGCVRVDIPPIRQPALHARFCSAVLQPRLQLCCLGRHEKRVHGGLCLRECGVGEMRSHGLEVFRGGGGEGGHWKMGQRGLETKHGWGCRVNGVTWWWCLWGRLCVRRSTERTTGCHGRLKWALKMQTKDV
jgi:hypothetical protein